MEQHRDVLHLLAEAVSKVDFSKFDDIVRGQVDMGRIVGSTACVRTSPTDQIVYARRVGRDQDTRFVMNREHEPTRFVSFIATKKRKTLITAYFGTLSPREPWDKFNNPQDRYEAIAFWEQHTLVFGSQEVLPGGISRQIA
jgi:hypothetical protein